MNNNQIITSKEDSPEKRIVKIRDNIDIVISMNPEKILSRQDQIEQCNKVLNLLKKY
jgi:hypothetical protein